MTNIVEKDIKFSGRIFDVEQRKIFHNGQTIYRDVVTKNDVVVCLVHNEDKDTVVLTKEYRAGTNKVEVGFVAGIVDEGESPIAAAIREVGEETGYIVRSSLYMGMTSASAGFTNERVHHYLMIVSGEPGDQMLDHDESIERIEVKSFDLERLFLNGTIRGNHAHTTLLKAILNGVLLNREPDYDDYDWGDEH